MSTRIKTCQICLVEQEVDSYDDYVYSKCGQTYMYDEGHAIKLTEDQLAILRESNNAVPSNQD